MGWLIVLGIIRYAGAAFITLGLISLWSIGDRDGWNAIFALLGCAISICVGLMALGAEKE